MCLAEHGAIAISSNIRKVRLKRDEAHGLAFVAMGEIESVCRSRLTQSKGGAFSSFRAIAR